MADNGMEESATPSSSRRWRMVGWIVLGMVGGAALALLFVAYGQPALLLEQMNLRYCG